MSTLTEIEAAADRLSPEEKLRLVRFLVHSMPPTRTPMPEPRDFTVEEMSAWLDEDQRAGREFLARRAAAQTPEQS
jgi:hypothetical protein